MQLLLLLLLLFSPYSDVVKREENALLLQKNKES